VPTHTLSQGGQQSVASCLLAVRTNSLAFTGSLLAVQPSLLDRQGKPLARTDKSHPAHDELAARRTSLLAVQVKRLVRTIRLLSDARRSLVWSNMSSDRRSEFGDCVGEFGRCADEEACCDCQRRGCRCEFASWCCAARGFQIEFAGCVSLLSCCVDEKEAGRNELARCADPSIGCAGTLA